MVSSWSSAKNIISNEKKIVPGHIKECNALRCISQHHLNFLPSSSLAVNSPSSSSFPADEEVSSEHSSSETDSWRIHLISGFF